MRSWDSFTPESTLYRVPDPRTTTAAARYARKIIKGITTEIETEEYVQKLRVSKLPICGLLDAIERIEKPTQQVPYKMSFYTSIGTAVHETLQQRMARSAKYGKMVFGNWRCIESDCQHLIKLCKRPDSLVCPKCQHGRLQYEEIEFKLHGVSGHLDMLTLDKKGRFVAWEFKTSNEWAVFNPAYLPYLKHRMQIETYCMMLLELYNIRVSHYIIVYISRNRTEDESNPLSDEHFTPFPFKVTDKMLARRKKQVLRLEHYDKLILDLLAGPTRNQVHRLERNRPCKSLDDYHNKRTGMKYAFFGKEECPFFKKGLCFDDRDHGTEAGMKLKRLLKL